MATAPTCTSLTNPADGAMDIAMNLSNISWNAVADADGYRLTVTGSSSNTNNETNLDITSGTTHNFTNDFDSGETVSVTIVPYNTAGDATGCASESFAIVSAEPVPTVPECTSLSSPLGGDIDVAIDTDISWTPANGADGYRLSIGSTSAGNDILDNEDVGLLTTFSLTENLPFNTIIYVTITPYNTEGDAISCSEQSFTTILEEQDDETLYGLSPNGDGINDFWTIDGIEASPNNKVLIYNRWGDLVFQISGYDNQSKVFRGTANMKTGMGADQLPSGTYFFNIQNDGETLLRKTQGFLVLKR
jgi:gliding motility-associated-like protein